MEQHSKEEILNKWEEFLEETVVETVAINLLKPSEINPRFIKDDKFRKLMQDILKDPDFMWQRPILAHKVGDSLEIYAGHQRWKACLELGWTEVPVSIEENLDQDTMKSRMVMDNVYYGVWDEEKFPEFKDDLLTHLDISAMDGISMHFDTDKNYRSDMDKPLKNPNEDRAEDESNTEAGKHAFTLIFTSEQEREEFQELAQNFAGDERFEDKLSNTLKQIYETE